MIAVSNLFGQSDARDLYLLMGKEDPYPNLALHLKEGSDMYKLAHFSLPHVSGEWISEGRKAGFKIFESVDEMTEYIHALDHPQEKEEEPER